MTATLSFPQQYANALAWLDLYDASNDAFLKSLKSQLATKKRLSPKQITWLVKKYNNVISTATPKSPVSVVPTNIPDASTRAQVVNFLISYNGTFKFLLDMRDRLVNQKVGLSDNQWNAVYKCYNRENRNAIQITTNTPSTVAPAPVMIDFATPIPVTLNRTAAMKIKKKYNLMFGPFTVEILGFIPTRRNHKYQTFKFRVNAAGAVNVCRICGKSLKDQKSVVSGIGPVCAKGLGHMYHTYQTDIQKFMQQFADECNKIGVMEADFSLYHVKDNMQRLQMEMDDLFYKKAQTPVAVNSVAPVPAQVLTPVNTPVTVDPVIPVVKYDPTSKLIRVKDNGVNQQIEFHINAEGFRQLLIDSGLVLVTNSLKLLNTISNTSVLFNRQGMSNIFKGQNMDKVIMFNITEEI